MRRPLPALRKTRNKINPYMKNHRIRGALGAALTAVGLWAGPVVAGTATFDFNTDPSGILNFVGSAQWRPTGGVDGTGYLSITDAVNSQGGTILFDDFDGGAVVNSFEFTAFLRTGGGTDSPADGYSVSFARPDDPIVVGEGTGDFAGWGGEASLPEEGTRTGVSIGLDEWDSGGGDVVGISVRVDNVLINQTALPTRNGSVTDTTSLQTGPANRPLDENFSVPDHQFAELKIKMDADATLDVIFKGRKILDNFQTTWFPSPGRIVFAGRTGGSNAHHHVDNITVVTTAATLPTLTAASLTPLSFAATITDSPASVVDPARPLTVTIDGVATAVTRSKTGAETSLSFTSTPPNFYAPGNHVVVINARDTNNNPIVLERTVITSPYTLLSDSWKAAAGQVITTTPSFLAKIHQINFARFPGDSNLLPLPERQMADGFFDGAAGTIAANISIPGEQSDGSYLIDDVINWDQDSAQQGNFGGESPIPGIPGTTGSTDNITGEVFAWLDLPAGVTKLGVNSDDGFTVSFGANAFDYFTRVKAGEFNGGRGASDTTFDVAAPVAGLYPVRLLWWEGGGGANLEFFSVRASDGVKILINDPAEPGAIKAYAGGLPTLPALHNISPFPGITDNDPRHPIRIELKDGVTTVNDASIVLTVDGTAVTPQISNLGINTVVSYAPAGVWAPGNHSVTLAYSTSAGVARSESWTFGVLNYATLTAADGVPASAVAVPGYKARVYQVATRTGTPSVDTVNWNEVTDAILAGSYGENVADLSTATNGIFASSGVLNWNQDAPTQAGNFGDEIQIPGIPGTTGSTDNITAEVLSWVVFPNPGIYTMGVNSDDNFRVTLGHDGPARHLVQTSGSANVPQVLPSVDGTRSFGSIGAPLNGILEAQVVVADPLLADAPLNNAAAVAGKICYVDRGAVTYATKILNAQAAGAIAVIVGNSNDGYPITMGGDPAGINIPAVMIDISAGAAIKAAVAAGDPLRASLGYDTALRLGEFQGGRGASDTTFMINVRDAGAYPLRLTWKEGNGGANLEWFSVAADGSKVLVNDPANPASLKVFQERVGGAAAAEIQSITINRSTGAYEVVWKSTPGQSFRVDSSLTLANGSWTTLADNVPAGAGTTTTFSGVSPIVTAEPRLFMRVITK